MIRTPHVVALSLAAGLGVASAAPGLDGALAGLFAALAALIVGGPFTLRSSPSPRA